MIENLTHRPLFVMDLNVGYQSAHPIGMTAVGFRGIYPVDGGTFEGERLRGTVDAGGSDWVTQRSDGLMLIDVRLSLLTDDGAVIAMSYTGIARAGSASLMERFRRREVLDYEDFYLRTTPRFETAHEKYTWLNGLVTVSNGKRTDRGGIYHVFEIT